MYYFKLWHQAASLTGHAVRHQVVSVEPTRTALSAHPRIELQSYEKNRKPPNFAPTFHIHFTFSHHAMIAAHRYPLSGSKKIINFVAAKQ